MRMCALTWKSNKSREQPQGWGQSWAAQPLIKMGCLLGWATSMQLGSHSGNYSSECCTGGQRKCPSRESHAPNHRWTGGCRQHWELPDCPPAHTKHTGSGGGLGRQPTKYSNWHRESCHRTWHSHRLQQTLLACTAPWPASTCRIQGLLAGTDRQPTP